MSDTLAKLQRANPQLGFQTVGATTFARYGRVLTRYDASEMIARAQRILPRTEDIAYQPSVAALEESSALNRAITREIYGGMPVQLGWCYGQNLQMAGLEYHKGTEVNVCLTDVVLLLGDVRDIDYADPVTYDTGKVAAYLAPAGSVLEFYPWNLHFAPIHVVRGGSFATLVYLPKSTNEPLPYSVERIGENRLLFAINKWLIVHPGASALVRQGAHPGMVGNDIYVNPI